MNWIAEVIGYAGMACLVLSFQCKKTRMLFLCQLLSGLLFVVHYGMNGDYTGMAMDGVCFLRALLMYSGKPLLTGKPAMALLLAVILALGVVTWDGIFSIFPVIALTVSTVFLYRADGKLIRRAQFFCTSPAWMVYNVYVMTIPGILCEALDMGSVVVYWLRERRRNGR